MSKVSRRRRRQRKLARRVEKLLGSCIAHLVMLHPPELIEERLQAAVHSPNTQYLDLARLLPLGNLVISKTARKAYYSYFDTAAGRRRYIRLRRIRMLPETITMAPDWAAK
jgi:hypothetical protein